MDNLPQDIIDRIVSLLLSEKFKEREPYEDIQSPRACAHLAAVSLRLQAAVERYTFRAIRFTSEELPKFKELLTPARRWFLTHLTLTVILPSYDDAAASRAESPAERAANSESYTQAIQSLFQMMKDWELEDPNIVGRRFELFINHPESHSDRPWPTPVAPWSNTIRSDNGFIHEGRYLHSHLDILRPEELPMLQMVTYFFMLLPEPRYGYRNVYPRVPFILASKMPNLTLLHFHLDDAEERFPDLRKRNRDEAAHAIRQLSLPKLLEIDLKFMHWRYRDETSLPPTLLDPGMPDSLSYTLCDFSQNLRFIQLEGVFDASLLRPLQGLRETCWPKLVYLVVNIEATAPSGDWYFVNGNSPKMPLTNTTPLAASHYDHSNLHNEQFSFLREAQYKRLEPRKVFRSRVNEETLLPFINAYVDSLHVMPKIRMARFSCDLEFPDASFGEGEGAWFCICYFAPCKNSHKYPPNFRCPSCMGGMNRQLFISLLGWEPSEQLAAKLQGIQDSFQEEPMVEMDARELLEEDEEIMEGL